MIAECQEWAAKMVKGATYKLTYVKMYHDVVKVTQNQSIVHDTLRIAKQYRFLHVCLSSTVKFFYIDQNLPS